MRLTGLAVAFFAFFSTEVFSQSAWDVSRSRLRSVFLESGFEEPSAKQEAPAGQAKEEAASDDAGGLAKKLSNPVADLISLPFQSNFDFGAGPDNNKFKYTLNIQPVIPTEIDPEWNLLTRVIMPVISQEEIVPGQGSNYGLGDINPTFFFSPKRTLGGWIVGVGPTFLLPTATDTALGSDKWAAGPSLVMLRQENAWTYGVLTNHMWSFAGDNDRPDVNNTFLQPFLAYNTKGGFGLTLQSEYTYSWETHHWAGPIDLLANQVTKIGKQPVSIQFGPRFFPEGPADGAQWGLRLNIVFLFPK